MAGCKGGARVVTKVTIILQDSNDHFYAQTYDLFASKTRNKGNGYFRWRANKSCQGEDPRQDI